MWKKYIYTSKDVKQVYLYIKSLYMMPMMVQKMPKDDVKCEHCEEKVEKVPKRWCEMWTFQKIPKDGSNDVDSIKLCSWSHQMIVDNGIQQYSVKGAWQSA